MISEARYSTTKKRESERGCFSAVSSSDGAKLSFWPRFSAFIYLNYIYFVRHVGLKLNHHVTQQFPSIIGNNSWCEWLYQKNSVFLTPLATLNHQPDVQVVLSVEVHCRC